MASFSLNQEFKELVKAALTEKQLIPNNNNNNKSEQKDMMDESAKSLAFFQDNKSIKKPERKCTTTHIKSRNFLSNIYYVGINKEDFYNENLIFNIYLLMTKNLNPFLLDRKLNDLNKQRNDIHDLEGMHASRFLQIHVSCREFYLS